MSTDWCRTLMIDGRNHGASVTRKRSEFPLNLQVDYRDLCQVTLRRKMMEKKTTVATNGHKSVLEKGLGSMSHKNGYHVNENEEPFKTRLNKYDDWIKARRNHVKVKKGFCNKWFGGWDASCDEFTNGDANDEKDGDGNENGEGEEKEEEEELEAVGAPDCVRTSVKKLPLNATFTRCGHMFHSNCIDMWTQQSPKAVCPLCREALKRSIRQIGQMFF